MIFPSEETRKRNEERGKRNRENFQVDFHQGPVLTPNLKGARDDYIDYLFNIEKEAGKLNVINYLSSWIKK